MGGGFEWERDESVEIFQRLKDGREGVSLGKGMNLFQYVNVNRWEMGGIPSGKGWIVLLFSSLGRENRESYRRKRWMHGNISI